MVKVGSLDIVDPVIFWCYGKIPIGALDSAQTQSESWMYLGCNWSGGIEHGLDFRGRSRFLNVLLRIFSWNQGWGRRLGLDNFKAFDDVIVRVVISVVLRLFDGRQVGVRRTQVGAAKVQLLLRRAVWAENKRNKTGLQPVSRMAGWSVNNLACSTQCSIISNFEFCQKTFKLNP